jgi:hypothetical protein
MTDPSLLPLRIGLGQLLGGTLNGKPQLVENLPNMVFMIAHPKLDLNHMPDSSTCPNSRRESIGYRTTVQNLSQSFQLLVLQSPWSPRVLPFLEPCYSQALVPLQPIEYTSATHIDRGTDIFRRVTFLIQPDRFEPLPQSEVSLLPGFLNGLFDRYLGLLMCSFHLQAPAKAFKYPFQEPLYYT